MEIDKLSGPDREDSENIPRIYSIVELKGIASSTRREFLTNTMKLIGAGGTILLASQLLSCLPLSEPSSKTTPSSSKTTAAPSTHKVKPVAVIHVISPNPAYLGESVSFTGGSTDSTIEITEYTWSVEGYGPIGYQSSFTTNEVTRHPGTYTVTLQVKSKDGVWSELAARTLTVLSQGEISKPVAVILAISPNPATVGDSVSFTGSSSDSAVEITEYLWKIVDYNLTDSRKSFTTSTVTQKAGTYAVTLLIKSKDGIWSDPVTETLTVLPEKDTRKPVAVISVISPNPATVGDSVTFTGSSSDATIVITEYLWSIVSLNLTDSRKTFTTSTVTQKAGTYSVTFKIKSKDGIWSDIVTKTLTVVPVTTSCTCDTVCTCVGHCTCDTVCTCQSHGGTFCTCDMVHYWYPN